MSCFRISYFNIRNKLTVISSFSAWADLMLGLVVLPFSAVYEIFSIWIFGKVWCSIWLAVDVWMCTASILHLVVISLDRYIAVTHPITYPNLMTSKKAKLLIAGAWVISFVVCFPPLVGWNEKSSSSMQDLLMNIIEGDFVNGTSGIFFSRKDSDQVWNNRSQNLHQHFPETFFISDLNHSIHKSIISNSSSNLNNSSNSSSFSNQVDEVSYKQVVVVAYELQSIIDRCQPKCTLTQEPGYVIYSAVGSFYAPMLVMMFLNWKIYRTALKTTKAIRQGWTKVKGVGGGPGNVGQIGMGIHRGGGIKSGREELPKGGSCKINNKKLQNQKTCPQLLKGTQPVGGDNNFLAVSASVNDRRLSLNVPLRSNITRQNRSRNSPIVPRQVLQEESLTDTSSMPNKNPSQAARVAAKKKPVSVDEVNDTCEQNKIATSNTDKCCNKMNQKKEECLKNASNRINSLSSSKSHSSINAGTGNKNKQCNNGQTGEDYYKTHSLTSIPNERSLDHVMNHTNLLYSSANSKRLKKPINDKKNGINSIDHVDSPEEKLDHKNQYSKGGNLNEGKVEQVRSEISTVHNSVAVSNGKKEMTTSLKQNSSHVPFNNFHYNRNYQCRHSRKTFSEQCTQTDPKSSTTIEDEERTQKPHNGTINGAFGAHFNNLRLKRIFSKKLTTKDLDTKLIGTENNKKGQQCPTAAQLTSSVENNIAFGCNSVPKRKGTESILQNPMNEEEIEHMLDSNSISSKTAGESSKPYLCLQCHPRRWTRRKKKFISCCWTEASNKKETKTSMMMSFKRPNTSSGAAELSETGLNEDENGDITPPDFHSSAGDDIHIYPLTGVAAMINQVVNQTVNITAVATGPTGVANKPGGRHFGKRNIKSQVRRFRMETKAAKTLGIIIGCFICCWFPFFTIYLTAAFCSDCIPELVFDIFFWLGYCNSALNPFIYAMFSREFRGAFKRIFYKLFCMTYEEKTNAHSIIVSTFNHKNMDLNTAQSTTTANSDPTRGENKSKHNLL